MKMLAELGQTPNLADAALSHGSRQILGKPGELDWPAVFRLRLSEEQNVEIGRFLHGFLIYHLGKIAKGRGGVEV
jgi:hypothetical protein